MIPIGQRGLGFSKNIISFIIIIIIIIIIIVVACQTGPNASGLFLFYFIFYFYFYFRDIAFLSGQHNLPLVSGF